jgi:hypothetical protein
LKQLPGCGLSILFYPPFNAKIKKTPGAAQKANLRVTGTSPLVKVLARVQLENNFSDALGKTLIR